MQACDLNKPYSAKQIAEKYNLTIKQAESLLQDGTQVEFEHTKDKATARAIASHHIYKESKDYYPALDKMEAKFDTGGIVSSEEAAIIEKYNALIAEKEAVIKSTKIARSRLQAQLQSRVGLFGDTKETGNELFETEFSPTKESFGNALKPYDDKISKVQSEIDLLEKQKRGEIVDAKAQFSMAFGGGGGIKPDKDSEEGRKAKLKQIIDKIRNDKFDKVSMDDLGLLDDEVFFTIDTGGYGGGLTKKGLSEFIENWKDEILEKVQVVSPEYLTETEISEANKRVDAKMSLRDLDESTRKEIFNEYVKMYGEPPTRYIKLIGGSTGKSSYYIDIYPFSETGSSVYRDYFTADRNQRIIEELRRYSFTDKRKENPRSVEIAQSDMGDIVGFKKKDTPLHHPKVNPHEIIGLPKYQLLNRRKYDEMAVNHWKENKEGKPEEYAKDQVAFFSEYLALIDKELNKKANRDIPNMKFSDQETMPKNVKENLDRGKKITAQQEKELPKEFYKTLDDGTKVYMVDGKYVRGNIFIDFTQGGHGYVYPNFIAKDEIWLDNSNKDEAEAVLLHELTERDLMKDKGMSYSEAHDISSAKEIKFRKEENKSEAKPELDMKTKLKNRVNEINAAIKNGIRVTFKTRSAVEEITSVKPSKRQPETEFEVFTKEHTEKLGAGYSYTVTKELFDWVTIGEKQEVSQTKNKSQDSWQMTPEVYKLMRDEYLTYDEAEKKASSGKSPKVKIDSKEEWEMTFVEYEKHFRIVEPDLTHWDTERIQDRHKDIVKSALENGLAIPENVLSEYPDLKEIIVPVEIYTAPKFKVGDMVKNTDSGEVAKVNKISRHPYYDLKNKRWSQYYWFCNLDPKHVNHMISEAILELYEGSPIEKRITALKIALKFAPKDQKKLIEKRVNALTISAKYANTKPVETASSPVPEVIKEAWEMTSEEWVKMATDKSGNNVDVVAIAKSAHANHVHDAVIEGKDVPVKVLEHYKHNYWAEKEIERQVGAVKKPEVEKEAWQMTKAEFIDAVYNHGYDFPQLGIDKKSIQGKVTSYHATDDMQNKEIVKKEIDKAIEQEHTVAVVHAKFADGKPVPENVWNEYKHLMKAGDKTNLDMAFDIARSIMGKRIRATTKDYNELLEKLRNAALSDFAYYGDSPANKKILVEIVAKENLEKASPEQLQRSLETLSRHSEKAMDKIGERMGLGRTRGGTAGALNRDVHNLGVNKDNIDAEKKRVQSELEKRSQPQQKGVVLNYESILDRIKALYGWSEGDEKTLHYSTIHSVLNYGETAQDRFLVLGTDSNKIQNDIYNILIKNGWVFEGDPNKKEKEVWQMTFDTFENLEEIDRHKESPINPFEYYKSLVDDLKTEKRRLRATEGYSEKKRKRDDEKWSNTLAQHRYSGKDSFQKREGSVKSVSDAQEKLNGFLSHTIFTEKELKTTDYYDYDTKEIYRRIVAKAKEQGKTFGGGGSLNPYAVCTTSIGKTAGTQKRSKWNFDDKERYDRCLEHLGVDTYGLGGTFDEGDLSYEQYMKEALMEEFNPLAKEVVLYEKKNDYFCFRVFLKDDVSLELLEEKILSGNLKRLNIENRKYYIDNARYIEMGVSYDPSKGTFVEIFIRKVVVI